MFTLLVSWLLVACIPALLMLVALGLGRLEMTLTDDSLTATDVGEFLDQADAVDVHTLAREGMPEALDYLHRRQALGLAEAPAPRALTGKHHADPQFATRVGLPAEPGLPTRMHSYSRSNPQFTATRHVNRV
ncbi:hypothetical protein MB901379_04568 [Mycobacterium basiliense]|uniref:Uncharacterized protein n=1 Tax=Mycobacterium basiliense TaxID=2094119 RepID=A0A447GKC0_9MYCO|nr:hypothetical protein [Mycobacterium basiliense]VDM90957.1 hypothetical protein MB901379_04568 [Mycobacterium basiliense]